MLHTVYLTPSVDFNMSHWLNVWVTALNLACTAFKLSRGLIAPIVYHRFQLYLLSIRVCIKPTFDRVLMART
jgi:hypothetical protein